MNQTPTKLIFLVVIAVAILACMGVGSICASLFLHTYADPAILTALISTTSMLVGSLVTMLSSTRSQPPATTQTTTTTTTPSKPDEPTEVIVKNEPSEPVPTKITEGS